jgi:hypothetical protein
LVAVVGEQEIWLYFSGRANAAACTIEMGSP